MSVQSRCSIVATATSTQSPPFSPLRADLHQLTAISTQLPPFSPLRADLRQSRLVTSIFPQSPFDQVEGLLLRERERPDALPGGDQIGHVLATTRDDTSYDRLDIPHVI